MNSQIFEEVIGEFSLPLRKYKTFQSIKYWKIIKNVNVSYYIKTTFKILNNEIRIYSQ